MMRILYFFPDNITEQNAGNKTRALYLLKYFSQNGFIVDYVSIRDEKAGKNYNEQTEEILKAGNLASNVYLLPRKQGKTNPIVYFLRYKLWDLLYYLITYPLRSNIPTYLTLALKKAFKNILRTNTYDYIIISYVHSADLIADTALLGGAKTIIDTHDFLTAQFKDKRDFNLGVTFEDEISRLNLFDEIWAISPEEEYVFNQFCTSRVRLVPMMMDAPASALTPFKNKKYDLIYVGNDNIHNIISIKWFFDKVYPLLPAGLNLCVIGKINNHVTEAYNSINKILFAESLESFYNDSKIAICPMLRGTGVKVKVVEALAFGLPVVCTSRGTDGLPNKQSNGCLVSDDPVKFAENIISLLQDASLYEEQSRLAKDTFKNSFDKSVTFKILDNVFE
ncbi:glycosyltransferase [Mucilaginibacter sp. BT774]|uniref:glycosyltransferase n=1 Tax=Mucilaginibacter sp. BT774 TaxID=3062276 RepID=UPI002675379B|nr:glycosyltransferase [Mucilaginibacter sp. BT774]MDO3628538.1 glycosyltransferase [Mucilaginibacter sp. BT774]